MKDSKKKTNNEADKSGKMSSNKQTIVDSSSGAQERRWYAVHTYSGYEDAVARYLTQRVQSLSMGDKIFNVIVPKEAKIKIRGGKRKVVEEKLYQGYVLVDMIWDNETWYVVRNTPRVTGFVGADPTKPTPLSKKEVDDILYKMGAPEPTFKTELKKNELVRINDGPFKGYDGKIAEIDDSRGKVKVLVSMFGRDTAVELDTLQVEKT